MEKDGEDDGDLMGREFTKVLRGPAIRNFLR
jgi:hypothetical protein